MSCTNIFRHYSKAENRYTNGLISILKMGSKIDKDILNKFCKLANISLSEKSSFKVLRDFDGTADAEISDDNSVILIETKIVSGTLRNEQMKRHIKMLNKYKQKKKRLILLTPDSVNCYYIKQFVRISPKRIFHISWNSVIDILKKNQPKNTIFFELVNDFVDEIKNDIFEQDISSVIVKINFGDKSGVYQEEYLDEFKSGEWNDWHTPNKYNELDGRGKKLILYDKYKGLVLEIEIENVRRDLHRQLNNPYPWSNKLAKNTLRIYQKPIQLSMIKKIPDKNNKFFNFDKCSTSHWNLTREQYEWLMKKYNN